MNNNNNNTIIIICIVSVIIIGYFMYTAKNHPAERLSMSQFPFPTHNTCKTCKFYTCDGCDTYFQDQNRLDQTDGCVGDYGGFATYDTTTEQASCSRPGIAGYPSRLQTENFVGESAVHPFGRSDGQCIEAAGTFDSGTTYLRDLPCPIQFPPVLPIDNYPKVVDEYLQNVSLKHIRTHLDGGGLIIAANSPKIVKYVFEKLVQQTQVGGNNGYPNMYYINGPIIVMTKVNGEYYWMIDYPIKYNPGNYDNYVNHSSSWNIAQTAYNAGRKLLNPESSVFFFTPN